VRLFWFLLWTGTASADTNALTLAKCLSCHVTSENTIDIIGLGAIEALPPEWVFLFEDAFDLNQDGVAGQIRMVSGGGKPFVAKYGRTLAAARFEDFAQIAGVAHDISLSDPDILAYLKQQFTARSPAPLSPFRDAQHQTNFERRGCAQCHVTRQFEYDGNAVMPLSDFLLHDMGNGLKRTKPLWSCPDCVLDGTDPHG